MKEKNLATLSFIVSLKTMATCEMFFKIYLPLSVQCVNNPLNESRCFRAGPSWLAPDPEPDHANDPRFDSCRPFNHRDWWDRAGYPNFLICKM